MGVSVPRALQVVLMWIVSAAWVANLVIGYFKPDLGQQAVNAAFMVVLAVLFRALRRSRDGDDGEDQSVAEVLEEARRTVGEVIAGEPGRAPAERRPGDET
jgi:membrane protein implicated in regulation of membrane protease activity